MLVKACVQSDVAINVPRVLPMASKMDSFHNSRGVSCILTQTRVIEGSSIDGLKPMCHGFMNKLALLRNHGPPWKIKSLSSSKSKKARK